MWVKIFIVFANVSEEARINCIRSWSQSQIVTNYQNQLTVSHKKATYRPPTMLTIKLRMVNISSACSLFKTHVFVLSVLRYAPNHQYSNIGVELRSLPD